MKSNNNDYYGNNNTNAYDNTVTGLCRSLSYVPASRLQVDQRPQLYVTSRKQLQPNQQRITFSITGIVTCPSFSIYRH